MPLEDSWNHFDSPLGKAGAFDPLSCQVCCAAQDYLLTRIKESGRYRNESFSTVCNGLQRLAAETSCLLFSKSSQKGTIGLENSPQNSLGDLMFHRQISPPHH
jgi:hypothetical protein